MRKTAILQLNRNHAPPCTLQPIPHQPLLRLATKQMHQSPTNPRQLTERQLSMCQIKLRQPACHELSTVLLCDPPTVQVYPLDNRFILAARKAGTVTRDKSQVPT